MVPTIVTGYGAAVAMEANTNSEMFEMAARREVTPGEAAVRLLHRDEEARKRRVLAAQPSWMPNFLWSCVTVVIVAAINSLQQRS